jgi:adenylyltransferase/sulfurtransferase
MPSHPTVEALRRQIASCEAQLQTLRQQLAEAEHNQQQRLEQERLRHVSPKDPFEHDMNFGIHDDFRSEILAALSDTDNEGEVKSRWPLDAAEYKRYGRQLIMPEIGLQGE